MSPDGKTYTFHLRQGVTYSGADEPADRRTGFCLRDQAFLRSEQASRRGQLLQSRIRRFCGLLQGLREGASGDLAASQKFIDTHEIAGVSAPDDRTLVLRSDTRNYDFLNILSMNFVTPLPEEVASRYFPDSQEFRKNFPSSGPYTVDSYVSGQKLVLKKVPNYNHALDPARKAYVDQIVLDFTANSEDAVVQKIQAGDADLRLYLDVPAVRHHPPL